MEKIIKHKGEELCTKHWCELSDQDFNQIRKDYYAKPSFDLVEKEFRNLYGGVRSTLTLQITM